MAATTTTITFDFTGTNPLRRWQFNPNGATSYLFSDSTISGSTAQTVADGSLFKISRSDDQYNGLTEGNGASISLDASMNELLGISSTNTFVKRLIIVPIFRTFNNYYAMNQANNIFTGEAGRWITGKWTVSSMFKSKIRFINRSDNYYMESWPSGGNNISGQNWGNFIKDVSSWEYYGGSLTTLLGNSNDTSSIFRNDTPKTYNYSTSSTIFNTGQIYETGLNALTSNAVGNNFNSQYKYLDFSPGDGNEGLVSGSNDFGVYYDYPLLTSERVRFEIPFVISIPQFQHVWTDWPWNKSRKTLTTDLVFTKIEFRVMYDTISEYKTKFYAGSDPVTVFNGGNQGVWLDPEKTKPVPAGYLARNGKYVLVNQFGVAYGLRNCQATITLTASLNGTVSSSYPSAVSGYGDYDFNPDVSYITLDAAPNYPIVFDSWEATDFDGNVTTISYDSTINVYNGLYASIKPIFTESTPGPTPSPTPSGQCNRYNVTYSGNYSYVDCFGAQIDEYLFSGDSVCASAAPLQMTPDGYLCPQL